MAANGHRPGRRPATQPAAAPGGQDYGDRYRWVALANTTAAMFMATLDGSIVIIALPAIFRVSTWTRWGPATSATCCG